MGWPNDPITILTPGSPVPAGLVMELQYSVNSNKHGDVRRIIHATPFWSISGTWSTLGGGTVGALTSGATAAWPLPLANGDRIISITALCSIGNATSTFDLKLTVSTATSTSSDGNGTFWTTGLLATASSGATPGVVSVDLFSGSLLVSDDRRYQIEMTATGAGTQRRALDRIYVTYRRDQ